MTTLSGAVASAFVVYGRQLVTTILAVSGGALLSWVTTIINNVRWRSRLEECMPELTRRKLAERDAIIKGLREELEIVQRKVASQGVQIRSMQVLLHKAAEIATVGDREEPEIAAYKAKGAR